MIGLRSKMRIHKAVTPREVNGNWLMFGLFMWLLFTWAYKQGYIGYWLGIIHTLGAR